MNKILPSRDVILCYHRLSSELKDSNLKNKHGVGTNLFLRQIELCRQLGEIVPLNKITNGRYSHYKKWRIAVTFDDGYADNIELGLPLFEKYKIPVTWFVASGYIQNRKRIPWWDIISEFNAKDLAEVWNELGRTDEGFMGNTIKKSQMRIELSRLFKFSPIGKRVRLERVITKNMWINMDRLTIMLFLLKQ